MSAQAEPDHVDFAACWTLQAAETGAWRVVQARGPVTVHRGPADFSAPGETLRIEGPGLALTARFISRGAALQDGVPVGFAAAAAAETWLFALTAPDPGRKVFLAARNDGLHGFLPGTLLETADGPRAVEGLRAGDLLRTADGALAPIRRLACRRASALFADPLLVHPVRIRAGALGLRQPRRDLLVAPDQAILLEATLVQAAALIDDVLVARVAPPDGIATYWRPELAGEVLILAEGIEAEARTVAAAQAEQGMAAGADAASDLAPDPPEAAALPPSDRPPLLPRHLPRAMSHRQVPYQVRLRLRARRTWGAGAERGGTEG